MGELSEPRWENYAKLRAGGMSKTQAALNAGYTTGSANQGMRLERRPEIADRIAELKQGNLQVANTENPNDPSVTFLSKPFIVVEAVQIHRLAKRDKQYAVSINALRLLSQLGQHIDNKGNLAPIGPKNLTQINLNGLTSKQLHEYLSESVGTIPVEQRKALLGAIPEFEPVD